MADGSPIMDKPQARVDNQPRPPSTPQIKEVTQQDLVDRTKSAFDTDLKNMQDFRLQNADRPGRQDEMRRHMLKNIGKGGNDVVHEGMDHFEDMLINQPTTEERKSSNPTELYDFALINDAVAEPTMDDIQRTIRVLDKIKADEKDPRISGLPRHDAQQQLCYTLVRQLDRFKASNPDESTLDTIRSGLQKIAGDPFTNSLLKNSTLRIPLALLGDEQALNSLGNIAETYQDKYKNRRFNLDTLLFEQDTQATISNTEDQPFQSEGEQLEEVRDDIEDIAEEQPDNVTDISTVREKRDRVKHTITSETSVIPSQWVDYDVPDTKALYDYIKGQEYRGATSPMGPMLDGTGTPHGLALSEYKYPNIIYAKRDGKIQLQLPLPTQLKNISFEGTHMDEFLKNYKVDAGDNLSQSTFINSGRKHRNSTDLYRSKSRYGGLGYGIADIIHYKRGSIIMLDLNNLNKDTSRSGLDTLEDFEVALENGLKLYRDFVTAALSHTNDGNTNPDNIPHMQITIDPNWLESQREMAS